MTEQNKISDDPCDGLDLERSTLGRDLLALWPIWGFGLIWLAMMFLVLA